MASIAGFLQRYWLTFLCAVFAVVALNWDFVRSQFRDDEIVSVYQCPDGGTVRAMVFPTVVALLDKGIWQLIEPDPAAPDTGFSSRGFSFRLRGDAALISLRGNEQECRWVGEEELLRR